jgi:hypothetical protein
MENAEISLISGVFESDDARDLLLSLVNQKIQYHQLKSFSLQERYGIADIYSESRIKELALARLDINEYTELAKSLGCRLSVKATIFIELLPEAV